MEKKRERIFGIVVLASLMVIFGPMLFEATKQHRIQLAKSIPEAPIVIHNESLDAYEEVAVPEPYVEQQKLLPEQPEQDDAIEQLVASQPKEPVAEVKKPVQAQPTPKAVKTLPPKAAVEAPVQESAEIPDLKTKQKVKPKPKPEPAQVTESHPTIDNIVDQKPQQTAMVRQGWSVQLGTFGNQNNAERLVKKLQADGFKAYSREKSSGNRVLHLVLVGPQINKSDAMQLRGQLERQFSLKGIVVKYQPN